MAGGVLLAREDFGTKAEPQVGHEVAVIDVAGASGFMRVVADLGSLLLAVEGLYW